MGRLTAAHAPVALQFDDYAKHIKDVQKQYVIENYDPLQVMKDEKHDQVIGSCRRIDGSAVRFGSCA
jgi:hypothetical protein